MSKKISKTDSFEAGALPVTNHDNWLCHFHVGRTGVPLTVYRMSDGTYQVWYGKERKIGLSQERAATLLGNLILRCKGQVSL